MQTMQHLRYPYASKLRFVLGAFLAVPLFFASCKKDDVAVAAPTLEGVEIGTGNNKIGHPGADFHIEAVITAPGTIKEVKLEIHGEGSGAWEFEQLFTEGFTGLKNATLHEHIDIPATAAVGHYHLHLIVTDEGGRSTTFESDLELQNDPTLPVVTGLEVAANTAGDDLHVDAAITAVNKIAKVVVEVHGASWEKEYEFTDAAMVGQTSYHFHKHVNIAGSPSGHYHVHMLVIDQAGKEAEFEEHFDK